MAGITRRQGMGLVAGLMATPSLAQGAWPTRPVTLLVPFAPGGASDIAARAINTRLSERRGQPVVVENRPGANGQLAARLLMRAAPDGHTLMVGSIGAFALNAVLYRNPGYDPLVDFAPVTLAVTTPNVLVVNPSVAPVRNLPELIAWMKARPGQVFHATSGIGSSPHLTMELFTQLTGTEATHVPSRGGATAVMDQLAGTVQVSFQGLGSIIGPVREGRLRALLVTAAERSPLLPEVPTAAEAGLPDFNVSSWQAVMGPAGIPAALLETISAEIAAVLKEPSNAATLEAGGYTVVANSPAAYGAFQRAEIARWRRVAQAANIVLD
ncbi:Bug family tripartite tricarboxylate transporter substrate binding protein [Falsiroseomonas stagni]|uniref:Tripartite-type tricarboxylate transporter, receptor component TctC n=1 Tax=Falsiroseomonas stagni DSM 19981 TaxID=1123062 RepID=A0A1I4ETB2_9PROT|nr:tripartite tricarboxylate transporter substrate binding protein [Falsiroseomonas stagni]SFL08350.1 Tripartite-type tricarboxylate transporter, receptor component TctC [Falsiroseomonas stagni DSM 19981]